MTSEREYYHAPCPSLQQCCIIVTGRRLWECAHATSRGRYTDYHLRFRENKQAVFSAIPQLNLPARIVAFLSDSLTLFSDHMLSTALDVNLQFNCDFDFSELPLSAYGVIEIPRLISEHGPWPSKGLDTVLRYQGQSCAPDDQLRQYHAACFYCLDDLIPSAWDKLTDLVKADYLSGNLSNAFYGAHELVSYWTRTINGLETDGFTEQMKWEILQLDNIDALKYFWRTLTSEGRVSLCQYYLEQAQSELSFTFHSGHHISTALFLLCEIFNNDVYNGELLTLRSASHLWWLFVSHQCLQSAEACSLFESVLSYSCKTDFETFSVFMSSVSRNFVRLDDLARMMSGVRPNEDQYKKIMNLFENVSLS